MCTVISKISKNAFDAAVQRVVVYLYSDKCKKQLVVIIYVFIYSHSYSKSMDQPGKVASPARGQLNRKNEYFPIRVRA